MHTILGNAAAKIRKATKEAVDMDNTFRERNTFTVTTETRFHWAYVETKTHAFGAAPSTAVLGGQRKCKGHRLSEYFSRHIPGLT